MEPIESHEEVQIYFWHIPISCTAMPMSRFSRTCPLECRSQIEEYDAQYTLSLVCIKDSWASAIVDVSCNYSDLYLDMNYCHKRGGGI